MVPAQMRAVVRVVSPEGVLHHVGMDGLVPFSKAHEVDGKEFRPAYLKYYFNGHPVYHTQTYG